MCIALKFRKIHNNNTSMVREKCCFMIIISLPTAVDSSLCRAFILTISTLIRIKYKRGKARDWRTTIFFQTSYKFYYAGDSHEIPTALLMRFIYFHQKFCTLPSNLDPSWNSFTARPAGAFFALKPHSRDEWDLFNIYCCICSPGIYCGIFREKEDVSLLRKFRALQLSRTRSISCIIRICVEIARV